MRLSSKHAILKYLATEEDYLTECFKAFEKIGLPQSKKENVKIETIEKQDNAPLYENNSIIVPHSKLIGIIDYIDDFFENLTLYDDCHNRHYYKDYLKEYLTNFIDFPNSYNAFRFYKLFFSIYQITPENKSDAFKEYCPVPNKVLDVLKLFKKYKFDNDMFSNCLNVFILGLAIYSQNEEYRHAFKWNVISSPYRKYYRFNQLGTTGVSDIDNVSDEEFFYRWGIASLFHDLTFFCKTYDDKTLYAFSKDLTTILDVDYPISHSLNYINFISKIDPNFEEYFCSRHSGFTKTFRPSEIMSYKIAEDFKLDSDRLDIGDYASAVDVSSIFSSTLILHLYGGLIQEHHKDFSFFYPIIDSASSILLSTFYRILQVDFNLGKMKCINSPLAYLLILCRALLKLESGDVRVTIGQELDIKYSLGLNSDNLNIDEKYGYLSEVLEIRSLFERDLFITSTKSNVITENETPNYPAKYLDFQCPSIDIVEKLAIFSHEQYINSDASISDMPQNFDEISPLLKTANFNQFFEKISDLISLGYEIVPVDDKREEITSFDDSEIYALGKLEHDHWCDDKYASGWTYGEIKDLDNLTTPYLVPWEELTPEIKELDLYPNKNLPNFVNTAGFKIVRR